MSRDKGHHQPRNIDKRKHHFRGFSESVGEVREARIGFKRYLQELEEQLLDEGDDLGDEQTLPTDSEAINEMLDSFISSDEDLHDIAREKNDPIDGTDYLMDEFEKWLEQKGFNASQVQEWMEKNDSTIYDFFYNGLT